LSTKKALFIIGQPPGQCDLAQTMIVARSSASAGAVLMGDGAYNVQREHAGPLVDAGIHLYALRDSVDARGLTDRVMDGVEMVDYDRIVDLMMEEYDVVL
jgi:sulfur relay protein TusB/DsrH